MLATRFRSPHGPLLLTACLATACFADVGGLTTGAASWTDGSSGTTVATTTVAGTTTEATTGSTGSTTAPTTTMTSGAPCADPVDQPDDAPCTDLSGCGCASGRCFVLIEGTGLCSECLTERECPDGGCTIPNTNEMAGAECNAGAPGDNCNTDAACNDPTAPYCGTVVSIAGVLDFKSCGECLTDADCPAMSAPLCAPAYSLGSGGGRFRCVAPGSVPNDEGCVLDPGGELACMSGHCGAAIVPDFIEIGVCGECSGDADCAMTETCEPASVNIFTGETIGPHCVAMP